MQFHVFKQGPLGLHKIVANYGILILRRSCFVFPFRHFRPHVCLSHSSEDDFQRISAIFHFLPTFSSRLRLFVIQFQNMYTTNILLSLLFLSTSLLANAQRWIGGSEFPDQHGTSFLTLTDKFPYIFLFLLFFRFC